MGQDIDQNALVIELCRRLAVQLILDIIEHEIPSDDWMTRQRLLLLSDTIDDGSAQGMELLEGVINRAKLRSDRRQAAGGEA